jgi:hypothetical protein
LGFICGFFVNSLYICSPEREGWCGSSVGRAKD